MVGLPARGKTYVARRLERYLAWRGHPTRVFNVGAYRREHVGGQQSQQWFSPDNVEARVTRLNLAMRALDDVFDYLQGDGSVAIYDATNTTRRRRELILGRCREEGVAVLFIEVICNDEAVVEDNIHATKLGLPDYAGVDSREAARDFHARIAHYTRVYETLGDDDSSYVKLIDDGRKAVANRIHGEIAERALRFLLVLSRVQRPIWLTRHGRSEYNDRGLLGGDADLTAAGRAYASALAQHVRAVAPPDLQVWTSTLRRTVQTGAPLGMETRTFRRLDEIHAGVCEGMSYAQVEAEMPDEYNARKADKFRYRYPRGESYEELIERVDDVVLELERQDRPTLIIGHQAVLRTLYAYLMGMPREQCPHFDIPLHTLIELSADLYELRERRIELG
jgi:broad specificity phosphatase PhoE/predicted kinase